MLEWLKNRLGFRSPTDPATSEAYAAYQSGNWDRAAELLRPVAAQHPDDAGLLYRLGDSLYQLNRLDEALPPLQRAARLAGDVPAHHYKLGNVLKELERVDEALECYRRALQQEPRHAQALNNSGTILETQGRTEEALDRYRQAVLADGALVQARSNLAVLLHRLERYDEASEAYQPLLQMQSRSATEWRVLGDAWQAMGRHDDAVRCYERALALEPASTDTPVRPATAPTDPQGWFSLGNTLQAQRRYDDALNAYQRGLDLSPNTPELLNNLGAAHKQKGALDEALSCFERAVASDPQFTAARKNLATTRCAVGLIDEAIAGYREILEKEPGDEHVSRLLLTTLLYAPGTAASLFEEHLDFARRLGSREHPVPEWKISTNPDRKLRIGYVSSDLRGHPVGFNLVPLIEYRDRGAFEIYLYSSYAGKPDHITRWFRERADAWRSIAQLSDASAAQLILQDQVDILVLLAGRFDDNRPLLATYRPAPVLVSMHDPATSGLAEMDYLIADRSLVPRHAKEKFTERVVCLPTFYVHPPVREAPLSPVPPSAGDGRITFGSFNNPAKINESVVALWAQVLHGVADSRLLLKYFNAFMAPNVRSRYSGLFRKHGIAEDRLNLVDQPKDSREHHLDRYNQIDIALDPFPFTGSTTTFEALSMGIPVVTLEGDRMITRWSAAMLRKVGLSRLIARSESEYVEIARQLASNPDALARLRGELPERVARSPLCAERARARQLERLYRRMWARWLVQQS